MLGYNKMTGYNVARYNADGTELSASETITMADNTVTKSVQKKFTDSIFQSDAIPAREITGRILSDEIRLADWLSIDKDRSNPWGD